MSKALCLSCQHFAPALDPNIARAFLGGCKKKEYPFTLILPLEGVAECDVYRQSSRPAAVVERQEPLAGTAAAAPAGKRVQLYYSSRHRVGEQFPCDIASARRAIGELRAKGVQAEEHDLAETKDVFPIYHKAVTGPSAAKRAVFGMKGALEEDFGRRVPALLIFEGGRYPAEVFPRMDRELNRMLRIEEALQRLLAP
ncbi:MAG: hypothetical protein A2X51_09455 [Candidatus Rokubacteria bacterium GWC2_70_24]|nr:MAG: hypothetical protein A2X53_10365 [Candidatus Rokubacteria bacterium GWA2_70_23]OGK92791.1 MAG: hypothetical protein A2X51_09455 [Candidatus Rokubacteria bacterium GWC2_70_24]